MVRFLTGPFKVFLASVLALVPLALGAPVAQAAPQTTVSLSFDDGISTQTIAQSLLDSHGMKGTFFLISGRLNTPGYLTTSQALAIQSDGQEIGGHTITHPDLPTLTASEQQNEICGGRIALANLGLTTNNFAYPFGDYNATTEKIVKTCGFASARTVGGIDCPSNCDKAETIPPGDKFAIQTPDSIQVNTSLATMESYVTKAENNGGGWVVLVMHNICNGCDQYSVTQNQLNSFLTWLQPRSSRGTVVKTIGQIMGKGTPPPPPPPPPTSLQNPSLEADVNGDSIPDCWELGGFGTNTPVWTRTSDAHSGSWAEKLQLTSYTDGDAKLVSDQHDPTCEPAGVVGHTDTVSAWYKSNQPVHLVAYYMDSTGTWQFWDQSDSFPAATAYTKATWTTPAFPSGASRITVGLSLRAVGTVTMDDFGLVQN